MFARREGRYGSDMKALTNNKLAIHRLDDRRYALTFNGLVRYVGSQEECERRALILSRNDDRAAQEKALARAVRLMS
jgi:hypothetical protein